MRLLVSGATTSLQRAIERHPDGVGVLLTPQNRNRGWWGPQVVWACDNGCFRRFDERAYLGMLARIGGFPTRPAWIACPDVVGDASETLKRLVVWAPALRERGFVPAFVGQDGCALDAVPWDEFGCFFVGGSTGWKLGADAAALTLEAHRRGKLVHWGRVNTQLRIRRIATVMRTGEGWCDTFDGSGFSMFGDARIELGVRWTREALADRQGLLFGLFNSTIGPATRTQEPKNG